MIEQAVVVVDQIGTIIAAILPVLGLLWVIYKRLSKMFGMLDNLNRGQNSINDHLKTLNGSVARHESWMNDTVLERAVLKAEVDLIKTIVIRTEKNTE